ncbi:unnamed protein product [Heligmosomoides polygyrus]|uniref:Uncharacterized protein n=1 Tax=Heligmosomoides polygyrus TaxID=6339 RepID=A0A183GCE3_HELPZ|nr:unnamed protein product [Heligmosomoides polygyrus]
MHEEGSSLQQQPPDAIFEETIQETTGVAFHLDPRDLQIIVDAIRPGPPTQPSASPTPVFKREGYAKQYDFNMSLIRKLIPLQSLEEINAVVTDILHDLNVRNETLKIADEHPEVFRYLETESKAESLRSTDPKLSEFMDSIKKRDEEQTRKRKIRSNFPALWQREAAWPSSSTYQ